MQSVVEPVRAAHRHPAEGYVSAHIFYHDALDPLIVQMAGPLVAGLVADGLAEGSFFLRYWDGGPHLRLRCRTRPERVAAVRKRILDHAAQFFQERPDGHPLTPHEYAAFAAETARGEGATRFARHPYPHPGVGFITYHPDHRRYGYGPVMGAVERHFEESSTVALDVLAGNPSDHQRTTAGTGMLLLAWFTAEPDLSRLAGRLRGWLASPAASGGDDGPPPPQLPPLAARMRQLAQRVRDLPAEGNLALWARSVATLAASLGESARLRILDDCAHLVCNRLGLTAREERRLRRLAAAAIVALDPSPDLAAAPVPDRGQPS